MRRRPALILSPRRNGFILNIEEQEAADPLTEINTAVSEVHMNMIIGNKPPEAQDDRLKQV